MRHYEVSFRTSPISDELEDALLNDLDATIATHGDTTIITVATTARCGIDAAMTLVRELRNHGVTVHRVEKDLVNAATIASRCGETRPAVANYIRGNRRTAAPFPSPEVSGSPSLWRWPEVNAWLAAVGKEHDDIDYLTREEETMVDHRLCVRRRADECASTGMFFTTTVNRAPTPSEDRVEVVMELAS